VGAARTLYDPAVGRLAILWALAGCGGRDGARADAAADPDAGSDASPYEPVSPVPPEAPAEAAPPELVPCAAGWAEVAGDVAYCDPFPGDDAACAADEARFAGSAGCERVGTSCPAGEWADGLPGAGVLYVRAGAIGGDGTVASPFGRIADAIAAAADGDVIALSKGVFDEAIFLSSPITIRGACVGETAIAPVAPTWSAVWIDGRGGAAIENLSIHAEGEGIYLTHPEAEVRIDSVVIADVLGVAIQTTVGSAVLTDVVVRDVGSVDGGHGGFGIQNADGFALTLERVVIERPRTVGVFSTVGATTVARDFAIVDVRTEELSGLDGIAMYVDQGASLTLERAAIVASHTLGVAAWGIGARVDATDLFVQDVLAPGDGRDTIGIEVAAGASASVARASVRGARGVGIFVGDEGSSLEAADVFVDGAVPAGETRRYGIGVLGSSVAAMDRVWVQASAGYGIVVDGATLDASDVTSIGTVTDVELDGAPSGIVSLFGADTTIERAQIVGAEGTGLGVESAILDASDVVVRDVEAEPAQMLGHGVALKDGEVSLARIEVDGCRTIGLAATAGTTLDATDVSIHGTRERALDGILGFGLGVAGSSVTMERASIEENHMAGVFAIASTLDATDLSVDRTLSQSASGTDGFGIVVVQGVQATLSRAAVRENRGAGVAVYGSILGATDLLVEGTGRVDCAADGCAGGGIGVVTVDGSTGDVRGFRVSDSALCGIQIARGGGLDFHEGVVARNPIGANVQDPAFDPSRLQDGVLFFDNDQTIDSTALPIPAPIESLE